MEAKYLDSLYLDDFVTLFEKKMSSQNPLKLEQLSGGVLIPPIEKQGMAYAGVLNVSSEIVSSANFEPLNHLDGYGLSAEILEEINLDNLSFIEGSFIYLGRIRNHWGHFLLDSVSRLWPVLENENKNIGQEHFIYFGEEIKSQSIIRFFELLGINKTQLHYISRPTRFSQLSVPQAAFIPGKMVHEKFLLPFNQIIKQLKLPENQQPKKLYLSRAKLKGINEWGETAIEKCFEKNGFQIIYPETLNLDEQIKWLQSADTIACLSGTLAHTLVFAKQSTRLIVINKSYKRENYRQSGIDEIKKLQVTYIDSHISLAPVFAGGPFWIKKSPNLTRFIKDNHWLETEKFQDHRYRILFQMLGKIILLYVRIFRGTRKNPVKVINTYNLYQDKIKLSQLFNFYFPLIFKK